VIEKNNFPAALRTARGCKERCYTPIPGSSDDYQNKRVAGEAVCMNIILKDLAKKEKCGRGCRDPRSAVIPSRYLSIGGTPGQEKKRVLIWELDGRLGVAARILGSHGEGQRRSEVDRVFRSFSTGRYDPFYCLSCNGRNIQRVQTAPVPNKNSRIVSSVCNGIVVAITTN